MAPRSSVAPRLRALLMLLLPATLGSSFFGGAFPGGAPFGASAGPRADNEGYYRDLGLSRDASTADIKRAYRRLAIKFHPDKGGDPDQFKAINTAYSVLSDAAKRRLYDAYGVAGVEGAPAGAGGAGMGGGMTAEDLLSSFFGGLGGQRGPRAQRAQRYRLRLSLEQLYAGHTERLSIRQPRFAGARQVGEASKTIEVVAEPGLRQGDEIVLSGEIERGAGVAPDDLIFVVEELPHARFRRRNADLVCELAIDLAEALGGFTRAVRRLDGSLLRLRSAPGDVIAPGALRALEGEGMPLRSQPGCRGRLFVRFDVRFPPRLQLSDEQRAHLLGLLGARAPQAPVAHTPPADTAVLSPADASTFGLSGDGDDAGDDGGGGGGSWSFSM